MQTQTQTLAAIRALGLAARVTECGEIRVAPRLDTLARPGATGAERREAIALQEAVAYYAADLGDALDTARAMVGARVH